jgi:hypothetical protein
VLKDKRNGERGLMPAAGIVQKWCPPKESLAELIIKLAAREVGALYQRTSDKVHGALEKVLRRRLFFLLGFV